ncbi:MAG: prepilin peptidase [Pseudomonadota bacterium]
MPIRLVWTLFSLLFGLALGSFLNVCIYRIPLKKSIVTPPSGCPRCGRRIKIYDNIPVLSYAFLLGKCRHCRGRISLRYPVVELITGLLSTALFLNFGPGPDYFLSLLFLSSLVVISFIDLDHQIIPDVISLPGILIGLIASVFWLPRVSWSDSIIGILAGGGFLYLVAAGYEKFTGREGMGGGDIKLLAMIGAWMGWKSLPYIVFISSLTGTVMGGGALLLSKRGYRAKIPFGPFLALGALIYFFFGIELVSWYFNLLR